MTRKVEFEATDSIAELEASIKALQEQLRERKREAAAESRVARAEAMQLCGEAAVGVVADGDWLSLDYEAFSAYLKDNVDAARAACLMRGPADAKSAHASAKAAAAAASAKGAVS